MVLKVLNSLVSADLLASLPYLQGLHLNGHTLAFDGGIVLLAAILFSLTPTLHFGARHGASALGEGSRGSSGTTWRRLGSKLVVLELATAMVLLVGAGLLGQSLYRMLHVDTGMRPDHLATLSLSASAAAYPKEEQKIALVRDLTFRLRALPGVKAVGISSDLPIHGWGDTTWFRIVGRPWHGEHNDTPERDISANYFATLGATILRGRVFEKRKTTRNRGWPLSIARWRRSIFRMKIRWASNCLRLCDPPKPIQIVGMVEDIKEGPLNTPNEPVVYFPFNQGPDQSFNVVVRTSQDEESVLPTMIAAIHQH